MDEQDQVDAMAKAIEDAIAALEYRGADYTAVEEAIAKAEALDPEDYNDFSAVTAAIEAVEYDKRITEQAKSMQWQKPSKMRSQHWRRSRSRYRKRQRIHRMRNRRSGRYRCGNYDSRMGEPRARFAGRRCLSDRTQKRDKGIA
ncbi:MAG: hypothetical protein ACLVJ6_01310 [Merdibacter sp.]